MLSFRAPLAISSFWAHSCRRAPCAKRCVTSFAASVTDSPRPRLVSGLEGLSENAALKSKIEAVEKWIVFTDLHVHERNDGHWEAALATVEELAMQHNAGCLFLVRTGKPCSMTGYTNPVCQWLRTVPLQSAPCAQNVQGQIMAEHVACDPGLLEIRYAPCSMKTLKNTLILQGDFWESRTSVKHTTLAAVCEALAGWRHPTIAIVGNHDQSNQAGTEHGMHFLQAINPNWVVLTDPCTFLGALWLPYRCAPALRMRRISYGS